ncbi:DUF2834 domain-containing protein [Aliarcobacter butzleri]|uniref:DUF2834 domain-containing protein n=1 Tax=Aliarcobacter butzleri TaxID=28197 RepID=UPI00125FA698|nr:DUF2834 domain-containing protein [Aliarcobacter butzleri]MCG3670866.1 DUF2834 domain-containing protein [Aliarcobacter butzleri]
MKKLYALLTIIGIILPFSQFMMWLNDHGFNFILFFQHIVENPIATFAWLDVVVTVIVIVFMVINDGNNLKMERLWIPIVASLIGGASVGLPLFLYMKQSHLEKVGCTKK